MHARSRRWLAGLLSISIAGCQVLTYDVVDVPTRTSVQDTGREPTTPVARVEHDAQRDVLRLTVGTNTTVHRLTVQEYEREREFTVEDAPFVDNLDEIDNELMWLIFLPIAISLDVLAMVGTFLIVPPVSLFADTSSHEVRTPSDATEEVRWPTFDLVDPTSAARLTVAQDEALSAHDLALLGFRSAELRAVSPQGEQVTLTLPPSAMTHVTEVQAALERLPADGLVRVAPGESLANAVGRAAPGAWIQLEAGDYELPRTLHVFGRDLTIAGRGAGRTRLRSTAATGLDLGGGTVTLRGLSVVMERAGPSTGIRCGRGDARLVGCAVTGARHEKVERTPEEVAKQPGDVYRGGFGVSCSGAGKTTLVRCWLRSNATAGALAADTHVLQVQGCVAESGVFEAVSFRGASQGSVVDSVLTGSGHGVLVTDEATATIHQTDISVTRAGILANGEAKLSASRNHLHGCYSGIDVGATASGTVEANTCKQNEVGILVSSPASVQVSKNGCYSNKANGISLQGRATPQVVGNTCVENQTGILCTDESGGLLQDNELRGNAKAGLAIQDRAAPKVERNVAENNRGMGLFLDGAATPTIHAITCRDNQGAGMQVEGQARPDVSYSTFERNQAGLVLLEQAGGRFYNTSFRNNRGAGVVRQSSGNPTFPDSGAFGNQPDWR